MLNYIISVKKIFVCCLIYSCIPVISLAQITVSGVVTSGANGDVLPGANVIVKGTTNGTSTDANGYYELEVKNGNATLIFSFLGFIAQEVQIRNRSTINITLNPDVAIMNDVVVVGYGIQEEGVLTSAITSVKSADIQNTPVVSASGLLQGRAAGVQVSSSSGAPGSGLRIKIRGTSSISGSSDPLYIVDGVPVQTGNFGLDTGGATTSAMAFINPDDIVSITILKDASATSIYGARAANGVVLIKTKRGADNPLQVQFGTYFGTQQAINTPDLVNGSQFEMLQNEAAQNNGESIPYPNPANAVNTNWSDLIFRTGSIQNYDLSISGGSEDVKYAISGGHFNQKGITRPALFNRSAARVNLDLNATDELLLGTSISYTHSKRNRARNNDNISGVLPGVYFFPTNLPVYQPDGTYTTFSIFENPVAGATEVDFDMNVTRFIGNVFAEYEFTPDLLAKASWSYDHMLVGEKRYNNTSTVNGASVNGSALSTTAINQSWTGEITLNYITKVDDHNFNVLVGGSMQARNFERTTAEGQQFPSDDFRYIEAAAVQTASSTGTSSGLASLFGRLQYNYDRRYLATLTVRRDASSRFGKNNQWGTFPSIGLGWAISEESFFNVDWVSQLKLRASYGITGNQGGIGDYQSLGLWVGSSYGAYPGTITDQLSNPDLKWETTRQLDLGLDIGFFDERLTISYDYYSKYTTDLLLAVPVPSTTGFQTLVQNFGELSNKGMELAISAGIIQQQGFAWTTTFNIAGNRNMIEKLAAPFNVYNRDPFRYKEGIPMFSFYFHKQLGVDPQTGAPVFADINGDGVFNVNTDRTIVGNANPDFFGGLTNTANFKQFDLSVFLQYNYGSQQLNWNRFFQEHGGTRNTGYMSSQLDRWQEPGDVTMVPKMTRENYRAGLRPSRFVEDGSYIRLKNITLGYSLPQELSNKLGISNARIYFTGQNVFTITNYSGLDPEVTATATNPLTKGIEFYTVPHAETYMVGFDITF